MDISIRDALKLIDKTETLIDSILREVGVIPEVKKGRSDWWTDCDFDEEGVDVQVKRWCGDFEDTEFHIYISVDDLGSAVGIERAILNRVKYLKKKEEAEKEQEKMRLKTLRKVQYEALRKEFEE